MNSTARQPRSRLRVRACVPASVGAIAPTVLGGMLAAVVVVGGCAVDAGPQQQPGRHPGSSAPGVGAGQGPLETGRGWSSTVGIEGPVPAPGACHYRHLGDGEVLPDPACTPGATDGAVRSGNLDRTVCRPGGYTETVRPPLSLSEPLKYRMLAAYGVPSSRVADYELDHLVPLSLGGSSSTYNLWPEPNRDAGRYRRSEFTANDKDYLVHRAWRDLCAHRATLRRLQHAMAINWTTVAGERRHGSTR